MTTSCVTTTVLKHNASIRYREVDVNYSMDTVHAGLATIYICLLWVRSNRQLKKKHMVDSMETSLNGWCLITLSTMGGCRMFVFHNVSNDTLQPQDSSVC